MPQDTTLVGKASCRLENYCHATASVILHCTLQIVSV